MNLLRQCDKSNFRILRQIMLRKEHLKTAIVNSIILQQKSLKHTILLRFCVKYAIIIDNNVKCLNNRQKNHNTNGRALPYGRALCVLILQVQ